jgi:KaiC/GvpD/RAD55 family RecA-like ATPase
MFQIQEAKRMQEKIKIGVSGPSGSGKTYSALLIARGMTDDWGKIALIDTENSGAVYSHLGDYKIGKISPEFTVDKYIEAIEACEKAGMEVIIIDSMSHEWDSIGGYNERTEKLARAKYGNNSWAAKSETKPDHQRLIYRIIHSTCHIICTFRSKTETAMDGKKVVEVGTKIIQDETFVYEFSVFFGIDRETHLALPKKDRTELFEGKDPFVITEETGKSIRAWAESGAKDTHLEERAMKRAKMGELLNVLGKTEEWYLTQIGKVFTDISDEFLDQILVTLQKKIEEKIQAKLEIERQRKEEGRASEEEEKAMEDPLKKFSDSLDEEKPEKKKVAKTVKK